VAARVLVGGDAGEERAEEGAEFERGGCNAVQLETASSGRWARTHDALLPWRDRPPREERGHDEDVGDHALVIACFLIQNND
jgi:hypothetical protein